jgi:hypothetical protein
MRLKIHRCVSVLHRLSVKMHDLLECTVTYIKLNCCIVLCHRHLTSEKGLSPILACAQSSMASAQFKECVESFREYAPRLKPLFQVNQCYISAFTKPFAPTTSTRIVLPTLSCHRPQLESRDRNSALSNRNLVAWDQSKALKRQLWPTKETLDALQAALPFAIRRGRSGLRRPPKRLRRH